MSRRPRSSSAGQGCSFMRRSLQQEHGGAAIFGSAVVVLAGLLIVLATQLGGASAANPDSAMRLVVKSGDISCDGTIHEPGEVCVAASGAFTLAVEVFDAPDAGYIAVQTWIEYAGEITYKSGALEDEIVWPDCASSKAFGSEPSGSAVNHFCISGVLPPITVSHYTGNIVELSFNCSATDSSTKVQLLPAGHPFALNSGTLFIEDDGAQQVPKLTNLIVNCGAGGPLPTDTPAPTDTPTLTPCPPGKVPAIGGCGTPIPSPTPCPPAGCPTPTQTPTPSPAPTLAKGNDDLSAAVVISEPLPYSNKQETASATLESGEPQPCAGIRSTVWYSFTPSSSVQVSADTAGSDFDTALAIYRGSSFGSLSLVACDDDSGPGSTSAISFIASAGTTYSIQVGGFIGATGNQVFNLASGGNVPPPSKGNDDFASAVVITGPLPYSNKLDSLGATVEAGEPASCGSMINTVWYSFTPAVDMLVEADTLGSGFDEPALAVYTGSSLGALTEIGCGERQLFRASAGVTYHFQVGACTVEFQPSFCPDAGGGGSLQFNLAGGPYPEMRLNVKGGDCDDVSQPTKCSVPTGDAFTLSVDIVVAPFTEYLLVQAFLDFGTYLPGNVEDPDAVDDPLTPDFIEGPGPCDDGINNGRDFDGGDRFDEDCAASDLTYKPTGSAFQEVLWPVCEPTLAFRSDFAAFAVGVGCIGSILPPLPISDYVGNVMAFEFTCSPEISTTLVRLLPEGVPIALTSGALFVSPRAKQIVPDVSDLTINCVDAAPAAVGGVALGGELRGIAARDGNAPWLWAALGLAAVVTLGALAIARRWQAAGR